ncbi:hypothetical protein TNCV_2781221 [Trichonephila clavipes]|nr:hypothetical protein TNCV_2781221 [Trichonephila clavipes]
MLCSAIAYVTKSLLVFVASSVIGQSHVQVVWAPFLKLQPLLQQQNPQPHIAANSSDCSQHADNLLRSAFSTISVSDRECMGCQGTRGHHSTPAYHHRDLNILFNQLTAIDEYTRHEEVAGFSVMTSILVIDQALSPLIAAGPKLHSYRAV